MIRSIKLNIKNMFQYNCPLCRNKFFLNKELQFVKCSECGTLVKKTENENKISSSPINPDNIIKYECVNCLNKFDWDKSKNAEPSCLRCGSTELVKEPPKTRLVTQEDKPHLPLREIKKLRFVKRNWRNYRAFEDCCSALKTFTERVGLPDDTKNKIELVCKEALEKLDERHKEILKKYTDRP